MITFQSLSFKNFLSVGNKAIHTDFIKNKKVIYTGINSSGKSTMQDALCFALYNKAFRKITKDRIVNSLNKKNLEVRLIFSIGNKQYIIERGVFPTYCRLFIDGVEKPMESSSRDYQAYIENSVLRMSEKTFRQIVVLGSTTYVPFMKLMPYVKRAVVEDLLEISIFSSMADVIKRRANISMKAIVDINSDIQVIQTGIDTKQAAWGEINESRIDSSKVINKELKERNKELKEKETLYNDLLSHLDTLERDVKIHQGKIKKYRDNSKKVNDIKSKIENNKSRAVKESKFLLDNDSCHVCRQDIDIDFKDHIIFQNTSNIDKYNSAIDDLKHMIENDVDLVSESSNIIISLNDKIENIKDAAYDVKTVKTKIKLLENSVATSNNDNSKLKKTIKKQIKLLENEINDKQTQKDLITNEGNCLTYLVNLLKDDGIKSKIIKTYLPIINKYIRKHLDILGLNIDFRFNELFEESIIAQHKDNFSYENFSTGQQLRIDMAILFTWRELSKLKNSTSTNLLILDEITSSTLDAAGVESFNDIIDIQVKKGDTCIIITHSPDTITGLPFVTQKHKIVNNFTEITLNKP